MLIKCQVNTRMDFVTICFNKDIPQMSIQAASMNIFLRNFPVDNIFVIVNELDFVSCKNYFEDNVRHKYGELRNKVHLIDGNSLLKLSYGHLDQMKLKILSAQLCSSSEYCILDTKNYLINEWKIENVFKENKFISTIEYHNSSMNKSFELFGIDVTQQITIANVTPYFAPTSISKLLTKIALKEWGTAPTRHEYLEFYLMQAAMLHHGIDINDYYFNDNIWRTGIWHSNLLKFTEEDTWTNIFNNKRILVSGIHRIIFSLMDDTVQNQQQKLWDDRKIATYEESQKIINEMRILNPNQN